jgi:hypothetical protein
MVGETIGSRLRSSSPLGLINARTKTFVSKTILGLATLSRPVRLYGPGDPLVNRLLGFRGEYRAYRREQLMKLPEPLVCTTSFLEADKDLGAVWWKLRWFLRLDPALTNARLDQFTHASALLFPVASYLS